MATTDSEIAAENAQLRARVDALETELAELKRDTAAVVSQAQETLYWFDRWGVDFNSVMSRPQADWARKGFRGVRSVYRAAIKLTRGNQ